MQEIHAELVHPGFGAELLIQAVSTMMLVELARHLRQLEKKTARERDTLPLAPRQLRIIHERVNASIELGYPNIGEMAALCGISEGHLARSFKAATGWQREDNQIIRS